MGGCRYPDTSLGKVAVLRCLAICALYLSLQAHILNLEVLSLSIYIARATRTISKPMQSTTGEIFLHVGDQ